MKIYTKTGDKGETSLIGGVRVPKSHIRIEAYGTVDELNSYLGLLKDTNDDKRVCEILIHIQNKLFTIGTELAKAPEKEVKMILPTLLLDDVSYLEAKIDELDAELPELKAFILPGGHPTSSTAHIARCVCRRAERICVTLCNEEDIDPLIIQYLNRLSDLLFVIARYLLVAKGAKEVKWESGIKK